jgi:hypothetical protein
LEDGFFGGDFTRNGVRIGDCHEEVEAMSSYACAQKSIKEASDSLFVSNDSLVYQFTYGFSSKSKEFYVCFYTFDCARHSVLGSDLLQLEDLLEKKMIAWFWN